MWWECSECGAHRERARRPIRCHECGSAGVIFTPVENEDLGPAVTGERRRAWLELGAMWRAHIGQLTSASRG